MPNFNQVVVGLLERFGVTAPQAPALDRIRQALAPQEFEMFLQALARQASVADGVEKTEIMLGTRRNDDRTTFDLEVAIPGGWRGRGTEMYLNFLVIITEPKAGASLDDRMTPNKGVPIKVPDGKVPDGKEVYPSLSGDNKPTGSDTKTPFDLYVHLFNDDAMKAGLAPVFNQKKERYEWPVVKCRLKPHFMFVCQALVFDKEVNLALQGSYRRGTLDKGSIEKLYARLNWIVPISQENRAAVYVLMTYNGILPNKEWGQFVGLKLGGETVYDKTGPDMDRRYHTYGLQPITGRTPQWAVVDWIIDHNVGNWNTTTSVRTSLGSRVWDSTEFIENAKDDFVYWLYDHVDGEILRGWMAEEREGTLTVRDVDEAFKLDGRTRLFAHRPDEVRSALLAEWHRRASEMQLARQLGNRDRETLLWADVNKIFDSSSGVLYRLLSLQAQRRDEWLDFVDAQWLRWFLGQLGPLGMATRDEANDLIKKGFGKHRKELSRWGNRNSWQDLLRAADQTEERFLYTLLQAAAGGRILDPGSVKAVLRHYGRGYDPSPDCRASERGDGHNHRGTVHVCEARKPGETDEHQMKRVVAMRSVSAVFAGWLNMVYDNRKFLLRYLAMGAVTDPEKLRDKKLEMLLAGKGSQEFYFQRAEIERHDEALKDGADLEIEFGWITDILLSSVEREDIEILREASADVWYDMMVHALTQGAILWGDADLRDSREHEYQTYKSSPYGAYLSGRPRPF